jgi:hypothetical protein
MIPADPKLPEIISPDPGPGTPGAPAFTKASLKTALVIGGIVLLLVVIAGGSYLVLPILAKSTAGPGDAAPEAPLLTPAPSPEVVNFPVEPAKATPAPEPTADPLVPLPTRQFPKNQEVFFHVQKDRVTHEITVLYQRGPGENILRVAEVKVTYPDGSTRAGTITPSRGETELVLPGSRQTDRVEVIAVMHTGEDYRVNDVLLL